LWKSHKRRGDVNVDLHKGLCDIVADVHHLPFRPSVFNGCFAYAVLEHIDNPIEAVKEIRRSLRSRAFLEILLPIDSKPKPLNDMFRRFVNVDLKGVYLRIFHFQDSFRHKWQFSEQAIEHILEKQRFTVLRVEYPSTQYITRRFIRNLAKKIVRYHVMIVYAQLKKTRADGKK
jgi:ubiquinone/menaquinone biosynthesis C-methylase UbiE